MKHKLSFMFNSFLTFQPHQTRFLPLFSSFLNDVKQCYYLFYPEMQCRGSLENGSFLVAISWELA